MEAQVGRRLFMGSVAAGLPMLVAVDVAAQGHNHAPRRGGDAVFDHLAREIARIHTRVQQRGPRGEDARALAAALRTVTVYGTQIDFDGKVKKAVRGLVAKRGRDQFLYAEPDRQRMREELRHFGAELPDLRQPASGPADYATRVRALDSLLARGASPAFEQLASAFEEAAVVLDRVNVANIRRVQTLDCWQWAQTIQWLEIEASFMCAAAAILPAAATACAILTASLGVYLMFYRMNNCQ